MDGNKRISLNGNLITIFGVTLMAVMGVTSITPAFPEIMNKLDLSVKQVGLLITSFTLPGIFLTPVVGVVADRYGRKRILFWNLLLFGIAGGLCGFTSNYHTLLLLRFIQGIGGAGLGALNTTLVGDLYEGTERIQAMGMNASVLSIGTAAYPIIGGLLASFEWQYPFLLPWLAVPFSFIILRLLKNPEPDNTEDIKQYLLGAWQGLKNKRIIANFISGIVFFIILYGSFFTYFIVMLGQIIGASPAVIGLLMTVMALSTAASSAMLGRLCKRFPKESLLKFGFISFFTAMVLISQINNLWLFILPLVIFGIGQGLNIPSIQTLLVDEAPVEYRGIILSLYGSMLRVGQALGPLLIGIPFSLWGYQGAFIGGATLAVLGLIIVSVWLKGDQNTNANY